MALQPSTIGESLVSVGGRFAVSVPSGLANTIIKAAPGRLCRVLITTAGTAAPTIYDNATTNSGLVIGAFPATTTVGQIYDFQMPANNGIVVANVASGPVMTISFE